MFILWKLGVWRTSLSRLTVSFELEENNMLLRMYRTACLPWHALLNLVSLHSFTELWQDEAGPAVQYEGQRHSENKFKLSEKSCKLYFPFKSSKTKSVKRAGGLDSGGRWRTVASQLQRHLSLMSKKYGSGRFYFWLSGAHCSANLQLSTNTAMAVFWTMVRILGKAAKQQ